MKLVRATAGVTAAYCLLTMACGALAWRFHAAVGYGMAATVFWLAWMCVRTKQNPLRVAAAVAIGAAALECIPGAELIHACVAPVLFTSLAVMAVAGESWPGESDAYPAVGKGLSYALLLLPPLVFLQITFGAAYRHKFLGVLAHMA